jgi:hypothetical protein
MSMYMPMPGLLFANCKKLAKVKTPSTLSFAVLRKNSGAFGLYIRAGKRNKLLKFHNSSSLEQEKRMCLPCDF